MAASASTFSVMYRGFVHIDKPSGGLPDPKAIQKAAKLLKSGQKTARAMHPLFARGLDTKLDLQVTRTGLLVTIPVNPTPSVVMNHSMHKIAYVTDINKSVCFIVKREGKGKFKCHSFECDSKDDAHEAARQTAQRCNEVFRKVRSVSRRVKRRVSKELPAAGTPILAEDAISASKLAEEGHEHIQAAIEEEAKAASSGLLSEEEEEESAEMKEGGGGGGIVAQTDLAAAAGREGTTDAGSNEAVAVSTPINFLDGIGDKLFKLVLGDDGQEVLSSLTSSAGASSSSDSNVEELNLDHEMFQFGQIDGELEC